MRPPKGRESGWCGRAGDEARLRNSASGVREEPLPCVLAGASRPGPTDRRPSVARDRREDWNQS